MTTLKFHFDDGSEALAHYGKPGMHWGVWDENTREKYAANPDLIGEFAKMLNKGGADLGKLAFQAQNSEPAAAAKRGVMGVQRGVGDIQRRATKAASDVRDAVTNFDSKKAKSDFEKSDAGKALNNAGKTVSTLAGMAMHPKATITNYGRYTKRLVEDGSVDRAVEGAKKSVTDFAKNAQKTISSAGSHAVESGARLVDKLFGTSFSKQSQARNARKRRRGQEKMAAASAARARRAHTEGLAAANARDKAKRERAMSSYNKRKAIDAYKKRAYATAARRERHEADKQEAKARKKHLKRMEKGYARDMAKREEARKSRSRYERSGKGKVDRANRLRRGYKEDMATRASAKQRRDIFENNQARKNELHANTEKYKNKAKRDRANRRTNDFYGYNGREAQKTEAKRRKRVEKKHQRKLRQGYNADMNKRKRAMQAYRNYNG